MSAELDKKALEAFTTALGHEGVFIYKATAERAITAYLSALSAPTPVADTKGGGGDWVMVPREPTEAMCLAGENCDGSSGPGPWLDGDYDPENVELIYKAMLAAAPQVKP